ncbi:MAG: hypothetical protein ACREFI_10930 [Stellaceae bacterium]
MLYMARTAHLQEDVSIRCAGVAEADAEATPWALLALTSRAPGNDAGWRLVGTYPSETAALAARRRLSRRLDSTTSGDAASI